MNMNTVDEIVSILNTAVNDVGGDWSKMIAGFNSANKYPEPSVALQSVEELGWILKGINVHLGC